MDGGFIGANQVTGFVLWLWGKLVTVTAGEHRRSVVNKSSLQPQVAVLTSLKMLLASTSRFE